MASPYQSVAQEVPGLAAATVMRELSSAASDAAYPYDGSVPIGLTEVTLQDNETNVCACTVRWKTAAPSSSVVSFGETTRFTWRIADKTPRTDHEVLVIGMHADKDYYLQASSTDAAGNTLYSRNLKYRTRPLPAFIPLGTLKYWDQRQVKEGWHLMTVTAAKRSPSNPLIINPDADFSPTAVMYDMEGQVVWYNVHSLERIGEARLTVDNTVLVHSMADILDKKRVAIELGLDGKAVWNGPYQPLGTVNGHFHHAFLKMKNGNYLGVHSELQGMVTGDVIVEMSPSNQIVWSWNSFHHMRPDLTDWDREHDIYYPWTHINAMQEDLDDDAIYFNSRNLSLVFKIKKSTGDILWRFGEHGDFRLVDTDDPYPWFQLAHGVAILPNGNIIMYDNGDKERGFSRAVEYAIDEKEMTAKMVWKYEGGDSRWFVNYWGDADRQENGNTKIASGTWQQGDHSRIIEVSPEGEVVYELQLPIRKETHSTVGIYNSMKIKPPLLERIP